jgi:hypothetical protein
MLGQFARLVLAMLLALTLVVVATPDALAKGGSRSKCVTCPRNSPGKIKRDRNAVSECKWAHPKPPGCNKCEVDRIVP